MHDLVSDGNSVLLVDHDTQILKESDWIIEMGPEAGARGGEVVAEGSVAQIAANPVSKIGPFLIDDTDKKTDAVRAASTGQSDDDANEKNTDAVKKQAAASQEENSGVLFARGTIHMETDAIHTVHPLSVDIPKGRLTVVTGVSGSGKTTMILESLVPGLEALTSDKPLPGHVRKLKADGIAHVKLIDATPIGINVRSTVATYANVHDELRKIYARTPDAKAKKWKAGDFSYNTGALRCAVCDGTGSISLDVQFLPDVEIPCPECRGSRYAKAAYGIRCTNKAKEQKSLPELMDMDIRTAMDFCKDMKTVYSRLQVLDALGLGYLTLGEETPSLSGGEAQRLKLASEMGRLQEDAVFVFDEPTIGLHPLDVQQLLGVFGTLIENGATVVVIEHDLDVIRNADYIIDMGPGGGAAGGRIVAAGTADQIRQSSMSVTGKYL